MENHVLSILTDQKINVSSLYHDSAVPMKELFFFLVLKGDKPEYFSRLPRIQDTLKNLGIISCTRWNQQNPEAVQNMIRNCKENEFVLCRVSPEFTQKTLKARGLRNDHFVLARAKENSFQIVNDLPHISVLLNSRDFGSIYSGQYFIITVLRTLTLQDQILLHKKRVFRPEKYLPFYFYESDFYAIEELGPKLRNLTGIFKILKYRTNAYYRSFVDTSFIEKVLPLIERYYAKFEYFNLKSTTTLSKYFELFSHLNEIEISLMEELKQKLEVI